MKAAIALIAIALAGCATVPPAAAGPTAGFGQVATINGLRIRPLELIEDSRCPALVRCVWEGRLRILAEVEFRGGSQEFRGELTLGKPFHYGEESVTLISAEPQKAAPGKIDPRAYRFTFAGTGR